MGLWLGLHHQLGGATDAAAGNPSRAAVLGRLLLREGVCLWPPAKAAQLSQRTEEAPGRLQSGAPGVSGCPARPPGAPTVTGFLFICACHGTGYILSAHPAPLQAGLRSREGRGVESRRPCTPSGSGRAAGSLPDCCWLLTFQDLPLTSSQIKSKLRVPHCQQEGFPTCGRLRFSPRAASSLPDLDFVTCLL